MNFKDEMKQKVAQIEIILDEYLPAQEGLQKTVLTAMNTTVKAGRKASSSNADQRDISDVWRKGRYRKAIYGSN